MANKKYWSSIDVENYLKNLKPGVRRVLPDDVYCTENFTWNEVLMTKNKNIDMPSRQILDNLKSTADVLQKYRTKIGKPITITSSWRTPTEQKNLINEYNEYDRRRRAGLLRYDEKEKGKPSETSLHIEGLALDFVVGGSQAQIQSIVDACHFGEREISPGYTHIGLTTFSKSYLQRNNLDVNKFYRKLSDEGITMNSYEKSKILKTMDARTWLSIPSHYDSKSNVAMFGGNKPAVAKEVKNNGVKNVNNLELYKRLDESFAKIMNDFSDIFFTPEEVEEYYSTGYAAPLNIEEETNYFQPQPQTRSEFFGYTNPLTGNNRIFTREDLDLMSIKDFSSFEKDIMSQMNAIGIPTNGEMKRESILSGDVIYVHPYVRSDGTPVSGYYRSCARC